MMDEVSMAGMRSEPVRIADVAREAGVSPTTVSFVLNASGSVSSETRKRVLAAVERLGYQPNDAARALSSGRTKRVAVVVPQIDRLLEDPYFARVLGGLSAALEARDQSVVLKYASQEFVAEGGPRRLIRSREVDAALVVGATLHDDHLSDLGGLPVVLVNGIVPGLTLPSILADDVGGAAEATRHLAALGHRRIAHIAGSLDTPGGYDRLEGYRRGLDRSDLRLDRDLIVEASFLTPWRSGREAIRTLLSRFPAGREDRPTAFFCANDLIALGAMEALKTAGLRVPEDASVVGADDIALSAVADPALTTVHVDLEEIARRAVDLLIEMIKGEKAPRAVSRRQVVATSLVVRASTAAPSGAPRP